TFLSTGEIDSLAAITDPAMYDQASSFYAELETIRISIFRADVLRALAILIIGAGIVYIYIQKGMHKLAFGALIALIIVGDMGMIDKRFLNNEKKGKNYNQWTEAWKAQVPYTAGNGDNEIYNNEVLNNPLIQLAVDSAITANKDDWKDMEAVEKIRRQDWMKFRILNRMTNYRVIDLSNPWKSTYASYFHKSIGGYHGAKLGRYQELIEFHLGYYNPAVLDMLNAKYQIASQNTAAGKNSQLITTSTSAMGNAWFAKSVEFMETDDDEIQAMGSSKAANLELASPDFQIFVNGEKITEGQKIGERDVFTFVGPVALPDSTVVIDTFQQQLPIAQLAAEELSLIQGQEPGQWSWAYTAMLDSNFSKVINIRASTNIGWDPRVTTLVNKEFQSNISKGSYSGEGSIELASYHPDKMTYTTSSTEAQLAVFSEVHYPVGWKAFVDGSEVSITRANYLLRAVEVPAGDHTVTFEYELESYAKSGTYANIGTIIVFLILIAGLVIGWKFQNEDEDELAGVSEGEDVV
ncbi:MAG: hypothetical protein ACI857_003324, partial [Arenicella sp.]